VIGVVLGKAFDAALGIMVKNWRIALIAWAAFAAAYLFDRTAQQVFINLIFPAWITSAAIIVLDSLIPGYRWNGWSIVRFWVTAIVSAFVVFGVPAIVAAIVIPAFLHLRNSGGMAAGASANFFLIGVGLIAYALWLGTRWSMAAILTIADNCPVGTSFVRSWELTRVRFWPTVGFNLAATLALAAIIYLPVIMLIVVAQALHLTMTINLIFRDVSAIAVPASIYGEIAAWTAYVKWLEWLKSSEKIEAASA
jgi:hypothetical protein